MRLSYIVLLKALYDKEIAVLEEIILMLFLLSQFYLYTPLWSGNDHTE